MQGMAEVQPNKVPVKDMVKEPEWEEDVHGDEDECVSEMGYDGDDEAEEEEDEGNK